MVERDYNALFKNIKRISQLQMRSIDVNLFSFYHLFTQFNEILLLTLLKYPMILLWFKTKDTQKKSCKVHGNSFKPATVFLFSADGARCPAMVYLDPQTNDDTCLHVFSTISYCTQCGRFLKLYSSC